MNVNKIIKHVTAKELENYKRITIASNNVFDYPAENIKDACTMYWIKNGGVYLKTGKDSYYPSALTLSMLAQHINDVLDGDKEFVMGEKKTKTTMQGKRTTAKKTTRKPATRKPAARKTVRK